jgi:hypothetical protein
MKTTIIEKHKMTKRKLLHHWHYEVYCNICKITYCKFCHRILNGTKYFKMYHGDAHLIYSQG